MSPDALENLRAAAQESSDTIGSAVVNRMVPDGKDGGGNPAPSSAGSMSISEQDERYY